MSHDEALSALRTCAVLRDLARQWDETRLQPLRDSIRALESAPLLPSETVLRSFAGDLLVADLRDEVGQEIFVFRATDFELSEFELTALRPGQTVCDVGAHIGYHTQIMARAVGQLGTVVAFEPTPRTCDYLVRNLASYPQVEIVRSAVGSESCEVEFLDYGPALAAFNSLHGIRVGDQDPRASAQAQSLKVQQCTLDEFFSGRAVQPHYVKIDVESAEMAVLEGMSLTLRAARPTLAVEVGDFPHLIEAGTASTLQLIDHLGAFGYRPFEFVHGRLMPHRVKLYEPYNYMNLIFMHLGNASPGVDLL